MKLAFLISAHNALKHLARLIKSLPWHGKILGRSALPLCLQRTFCCSGTYKESETNVLRNFGLLPLRWICIGDGNG